VLNDLLLPHSSIPYVQMDRSIALYTVRLLSRDNTTNMKTEHNISHPIGRSFSHCFTNSFVKTKLNNQTAPSSEYRHLYHCSIR